MIFYHKQEFGFCPMAPVGIVAGCLVTAVSAAEERNNLALGKLVAASSVRRDKAEEAVDGNESQGSRWVSVYPNDGSRDHTQWLSVDLAIEGPPKDPALTSYSIQELLIDFE